MLRLQRRSALDDPGAYIEACQAHVGSAETAMSERPLIGRTVLLVEDEPLISLDVETRLQDAGARVFTASRLDHALSLASHGEFSAAVLDFDLGNADSTIVCWKLFDRKVPFLFHTGQPYSAFRQWPSAPVVLKTATEDVVATLCRLLG